jgi:PAS domain S-box-containing protein
MDNDLGRIVDALPGLVWTADPDGRIQFLNARWLEITGKSPDEALGSGWLSAIVPEDKGRCESIWRALRASGKHGEIEARLARADGTFGWFLICIAPIKDEAGTLSGWCGINMDIDERKRGEQTLQASEDQLRLIVEGLPALVSVMTPEGRLARANRHYLEYFGAPIEELKARGVLHSFHPEDRAQILAIRERSMQSGVAWEAQGRRQGADGVYRWFQLHAHPLHDAQGRIVLWHLLQTDIQQQKEAEALLAGEKRLLEMVATGKSTPSILEALCHLVEDTAGNCYCSVVLIDAGGTRLEHGAAPSLPESFVSSIIGRAVNAESGPCAMAAYLNHPVIASDIATETRWADESWCSMALAHGIRSCWSMPITSAVGAVMGAFAIYHDEPKSPSSHMRALIDQFAHIASIALEREQAQRSLTQAMHELQKSEGQLRTMIDSIPGYVWRTTPDGTVDFLNQGWCDYTGVGLTEALSSGWEKTVHPDEYAGVMAYWRKPLESGTPGEYECRHRRHDGTYRWFVGRAIPLRDAAGDIVKWYGLNTDIEDRKRAELLLQGKNRLFEMLAGHSPLDRILLELCMLVESTMPGAFCTTMLVEPGRSSFQGAAAASLSEAFIASVESMPLTIESGPCAMAACLKQQVVVPDLSSESRWKDDLWYQLALRDGLKACWSTPVMSTSGQVLAVFAIYHRDPNIPSVLEQDFIRQFAYVASIAIEQIQSDAALGKVRSELARVARVNSLGALTASIAHEVNQPLFGITTNASTCLRMLANESPNLEGASEMARRIIRDGNRASEVITRLRAMFVKRETVSETVDLNEAAREVIALSMGEMQRAQVVVHVDLADDLPPVKGDRVQLQQVILNLCLNAADAMRTVEGRARRLIIRTERDEEDQVRLSVEDSGAGFDPDGGETLFDAFYTTKEGGMGIGLSVSRSIIEGHRGRLWATAKQSAGAIFTFALPIEIQETGLSLATTPGRPENSLMSRNA